MLAPSVNKESMKIVKEIYESPEKYNVILKKDRSGAHIIDAGINANGGFLAGETITKICLGGLGGAYISSMRVNDLELPSITVYTDYPAISTLGSQLAGWRIKVGGYTAIGSGPARALALKPKSIYEKIEYKDSADKAVLVLEASSEPPEEAIKMISDVCHVSNEKTFLILVPTSSVAGLTQVSGRIIEVGMYKLCEMGLNPNAVRYAWGQAPIPPIHPDAIEAMGRANDMILYGGVAYYIVSYDNDEYLRSLVKRAVSSASKDYGKPFAEIFREAGHDFYKIDPQLFAPAKIIVTNMRTGKTFTAGKINAEILFKSAGITIEP
ncbi:methenyltetrahydromethanopterin cyclohydrolase [Candidatus Bathyarchaeota archaeon]|nr:methenyltetrahydromethanopterin cyclohydrolase [Candidatus Bathyarchaeota archaeon]